MGSSFSFCFDPKLSHVSRGRRADGTSWHGIFLCIASWQHAES